MNSGFLFYDDDLNIKESADLKIVSIKENISEKEVLFDGFSEFLNFPFYFGRNWDAFYDVLLDLNWIDQDKIIITHKDIPFKTNKKERSVYFLLLKDLLDRSKNHVFQIWFPNKLRKEVESLNLTER